MLLTKNDFRQSCLQKIKKSSKHNKLYKNSLVQKSLLGILQKRKFTSILCYHPMDFEADIKKILIKMKRKTNVFIPFMENESFKMVKFRLPLTKNKFGILEAGSSNLKIKNVDIAIVPAIGVDKNLQRVGFGKGMYDRFYAKLKTKPYTIFVQPEFCYTDKKVCDTYDVSCDVLITPKKIIYKKQ